MTGATFFKAIELHSLLNIFQFLGLRKGVNGASVLGHRTALFSILFQTNVMVFILR